HTPLFSCDHPLLVVLLFKEQSMAEATEYDKLQDQRLDDLESLITAEYQPPEGVEYSYPIANQGITQEQFRNMMRGLGKGTITQHDADTARNSYRLVDHGSD
ncbi:MAG TPA: hypothetical protein VK054_07975, partial [Beutenbergiaceae bacterium]|nr:hypothetical protein [Beutenbergiaceae bacterium]